MRHNLACDICGATPAPFGYRLPGPRSKIPEDKRDRYLVACAAPACRAAAEARQAAASAPFAAPAPPRPTPAPPPQGGLFDR